MIGSRYERYREASQPVQQQDAATTRSYTGGLVSAPPWVGWTYDGKWLACCSGDSEAEVRQRMGDVIGTAVVLPAGVKPQTVRHEQRKERPA